MADTAPLGRRLAAEGVGAFFLFAFLFILFVERRFLVGDLCRRSNRDQRSLPRRRHQHVKRRDLEQWPPLLNR